MNGDILELAIPKRGHPVTVAAVARVDAVIQRTEDVEILACLKLLRFMVGDADVGLYDHIAQTNSKMWNDSAFNGIRTWVAAMKTFAGEVVAGRKDAD